MSSVFYDAEYSFYAALMISISFPVYRPWAPLEPSFCNCYDLRRLNSISCSLPRTSDYYISKSVSDLDSLYLSARSSYTSCLAFSEVLFKLLNSVLFTCSLKLESVLNIVSPLLSLFSLNENSCFSPACRGLVIALDMLGASNLPELFCDPGNLDSNPPNIGVTGAFGESFGDESSSRYDVLL